MKINSYLNQSHLFYLYIVKKKKELLLKILFTCFLVLGLNTQHQRGTYLKKCTGISMENGDAGGLSKEVKIRRGYLKRPCMLFVRMALNQDPAFTFF